MWKPRFAMSTLAAAVALGAVALGASPAVALTPTGPGSPPKVPVPHPVLQPYPMPACFSATASYETEWFEQNVTITGDCLVPGTTAILMFGPDSSGYIRDTVTVPVTSDGTFSYSMTVWSGDTFDVIVVDPVGPGYISPETFVEVN
jgi:hypothetical protein